MAFVLPERTRERTATVGTGDLALLGVLSPNQFTFNSRVGVGNETSYTIVSGDGVGSEEGFGILTAPTTFQRTTVTKNHLGTTAHISLSGESRVFVMIPGNFGLLFAKYFGGDFSKQILRYSIVTGEWEATLDNGSWKQSCAIATTGPLPTCTYANGTSGVGATLTGNSNGQPTIDAVPVRLNYRILVKDQVNPIHNGIYICTREGDSTHTFQFTRAVDYDDPSDLSEGDCVAIGAAGTANGRTIWTMQTGDTGINIGTTTDINWFIVGARPSESLDLFGSAEGDMLRRGSSNWNALAVGADGKVLTVVSGLPEWADPASGGGGVTLDNSGTWDVGNSYAVGNVVRDGADFYSSKNSIAASPATAPDLDGHNAIVGTGASLTTALTTTTANDTICAIIATNTSGVTVTSITSALTFTRQYSNTNGIYHLEIWTAPASAILTSESVVANLSGASNGVLHVLGIKGENFVVPLDPNATLPKYVAGNSSVTGISTSNVYDMLIYFNHSDNPVGFNDSLFPSGWTFITGTSFIPAQSTLSYKRVTAAQSNISASDLNVTSNQAVVFAFTSGNPPPHMDSANWVRLSGFDQTAFNTLFGTARGSIPVKTATNWSIIPAGTTGQILQAGTAGDPAFISMSAALETMGSTRGQLLARSGTNWHVVSPGTVGQVLTMNALGDPDFEDATGGGGGGGSARALFSETINSTVPTLTNTGLAWVNQGTATVAELVSGLSLACAPGGDNLHQLSKSIAASPVSYKCLIGLSATPTNYPFAGIGFANSTALKTFHLVYNGSYQLAIINWSNATSYAGSPWAGQNLSNPCWMRARYNGTNIEFAVSSTGEDDDFVTVNTEALSTSILAGTITRFFIFVSGNGNSSRCNLLSLTQGT